MDTMHDSPDGSQRLFVGFTDIRFPLDRQGLAPALDWFRQKMQKTRNGISFDIASHGKIVIFADGQKNQAGARVHPYFARLYAAQATHEALQSLKMTPPLPSWGSLEQQRAIPETEVIERLRESATSIREKLAYLLRGPKPSDNAFRAMQAKIYGERSEESLRHAIQSLQEWINNHWASTIFPAIQEAHTKAEREEVKLRKPIVHVMPDVSFELLSVGRITAEVRATKEEGSVMFMDHANDTEVTVYVPAGTKKPGKGIFKTMYFDYSNPAEGFRIFKIQPGQSTDIQDRPEGGTIMG